MVGVSKPAKLEKTKKEKKGNKSYRTVVIATLVYSS
jgi:hypothetical protein